MSEARPYKLVRALNRGIAVLQELNRVGSARPVDVAQAVGIDRTTAYRLLATLADAGLVRENGDTRAYVLTERVRGLSDGFTERDRMTQVVTAHLGALFQKVVWPTDFATFERGAMVIRETTHRFSPYSVHRAMIGQPRPLLTSALGRAALAGATPAGRRTMLEIAAGQRTLGDLQPHRLDETIERLLEGYARRGYAFSVGGSDSRISAIAVAVPNAAAAAAVNLVFFSSAMRVEAAADRFLSPLKHCAENLAVALAGDAATGDVGVSR